MVGRWLVLGSPAAIKPEFCSGSQISCRYFLVLILTIIDVPQNLLRKDKGVVKENGEIILQFLLPKTELCPYLPTTNIQQRDMLKGGKESYGVAEERGRKRGGPQ